MTPTSEPVVKDEDESAPVASVWRPTLSKIVDAFVEGDYTLSRGIDGVAPISAEDAEQIESYLDDYGETLVALPEDTWESSVSQWMETHWDVLVDLFTAESGASDLVLKIRTFEESAGAYRYEVRFVHVP